MIKIDGSYGEGGGQILRTSIALSCVTGKSVEIFNIRANRPKKGLAAQHLKGVEAAKMLCDAEVEGLRLGSTRLVFKPRKIRARDMRIDIGTAGSVTLIFQTILPPLLVADKPCKIEIIGGTDVQWSPSIDYFRFVTLKALKEMRANAEVELIKRGYYPKGGGKVILRVNPSNLKGIAFEKEMCDVIRGISHCSNLPEHVAERQAKVAKTFLEERGYKTEIDVETQKGLSTGSGITLFCGYKGSVSLGEKGKPAEKVGNEAASQLYEELQSDAVFDKHLADQVMSFAAIANEKTVYTTSEITKHIVSNAYVINKFFENCVKIKGNRIEIN
uniref:RNA 3'-terminal phosphate cyclase n=1 Tax=Geoglobus ahangari TaxID=113653 RepID=A0A7C3UCR5_9EURY